MDLWKDAKVGDTFYRTHFHNRGSSWADAVPLIVVRVTGTLIILIDDTRLSKAKKASTGTGSYCGYHAATPDVLDLISEAKAAKDRKDRAVAALNKASGLVENEAFLTALENLINHKVPWRV
ncbi:MAG: hypothetical protein E4G90_12150 [Gemmatimonadales bacterium]|nr:MAG: hypothetical protein E4G90_12150 [Gemmatimonadales bacterium]